MSQITIYLDDTLADRLRKAAERDGMSLSSWVAQVIADRTADTWPAEILALSGTWADEKIERPQHGEDLQRASL
jgi:predicted transcriptional regulator